MKNRKNIVILSTIAVISLSLISYKIMDNLNDNVYVVSESATNNKQSVIENKENDKQENIKPVNNDTNDRIKNKEITVYVSGEVNKPGVVTLDCQKRLSDAVNSVGGVTKDADLNRINLASKLEDEKHYIIPKIGEATQSEATSFTEGDANLNQDSSKININSAPSKELEELPGVGEATANKIIKYREETGKFKSIEEIKNVNGIGEKKYEDLKDIIAVD